jgi:serine/threonine protein kinase
MAPRKFVFKAYQLERLKFGMALRADTLQMSGPSLLLLVLISGFLSEERKLIWKLTYKLSPLELFGPGDKLIEGFTNAYCIAKIICLVGPISHPVSCKIYKEEFELAEQFAVMDHPLGPMKLIDRGNWRKELQEIPDPLVPQDLLDFIESLLIIDPNKRPTASDALRHPYLQSTVTSGDVAGNSRDIGFTDNSDSQRTSFSTS